MDFRPDEPPKDHLTRHARAWHSEGDPDLFRERTIHVRPWVGGTPLLLFLHGFPTSSFDWRYVLAQERDHAGIAFDFLGFGMSDKPRDFDYTLAWQADLAEYLVELHGQGRSVLLVAHDMGASVATELMARDLEGKLKMELVGALLLNTSIVQEAASSIFAQKLLRGPLGGVGARLAGERFFRKQFGQVFSAAHPLDKDEAADQWSLITYNDGHRIADKLISYMDERERYAERWHGAFHEWPKPLRLLWGMRDPVATPAVLEELRRLRPGIEVTELADVGHYPQLETPDRVVVALREMIAAAAPPRAAAPS